MNPSLPSAMGYIVGLVSRKKTIVILKRIINANNQLFLPFKLSFGFK